MTKTLTSALVSASLLLPFAAIGQVSGLDAAKRQAEILLRQEQLRLQEDQERLRQTQPPSGMDLNEVRPSEGVGRLPGTCVDIKEIDIKGADLIDEEDKMSIIEKYLNRCLTVRDIEELLGEVNQHYIGRGFITTRVYLPNQDLKSGTLTIIVLEGRIESLKIEGDPEGRINLAMAVPAQAGDLLNIRDLEQAVDQINSAQGNKVKLDIMPGAEPGRSVVVFRNSASRPYKATVSVDNQGTEFTGRNGMSASLRSGIGLGLGETLSVTARTSLPDRAEKRSRSASVDLSIPVGYATYGAGYSESDYTSALTLPHGNTIVPSGHSSNWNLSAERIVARDQSSRHSVFAKFSNSDSKNYINDSLVTVNSRRINSLAMGMNSIMFVGAGTLVLRPEVSVGLSDLDNRPAGVNGASTGPQAEFTKYALFGHFNLPFTLGRQQFSWTSQLQMQSSREALFGSQQILIGGLSSVRGFYNTSLVGDSGYYWRNELAWHRQFEWAGMPVRGRLYVGYDTGEVRNHLAGAAEGQLSGYVVGANAKVDDAEIDVFWTRADRVAASMKREPDQVWMRMGLDF
ncbi:ShlB/FhaC/HecB family hemolysin secretion/activation protein [Rhodocyclus purpureus]|uniref:ShlB/FhaC/HecB family hemolysin secretion/activation protein n=1 Tax=Rhodocyclus purpureus TaxID=1067 RepID=UPI00191443F1|nr:ShlB/FhaC/HecB family hemolysin secretion/activation protein [Rhodocyclus purpureus]